MNPTKRIVIIEGDAFDADAIVAIYKVNQDDDEKSVFAVKLSGESQSHCYDYFFDDVIRDQAIEKAIDAWRKAVGALPMVGDVPAPDVLLPTPEREDTQVFEFWTDEKGRYRETYSDQHVWWGNVTGRFIWNEGPPRRKNPLGEGASPIVKIYVGEDGKPLDVQPV